MRFVLPSPRPARPPRRPAAREFAALSDVPASRRRRLGRSASDAFLVIVFVQDPFIPGAEAARSSCTRHRWGHGSIHRFGSRLRRCANPPLLEGSAVRFRKAETPSRRTAKLRRRDSNADAPTRRNSLAICVPFTFRILIAAKSFSASMHRDSPKTHRRHPSQDGKDRTVTQAVRRITGADS